MTEVTPPPTGDTGGSSGATAPAAAPAPATGTPPAAATPPAGATPPPATTPPADGAYKIPDAYKDKPWASKIKSEDDLWKQLDNTQQLVGKKVIVPDLTKATDTEREEYYAQTRPADVTAYQFSEDTDPAIKAVLGETMLKNGVSAVQANAVIKAYQEAEKTSTAQFFSTEGMEAEFKKSFGDGWKEASGKAQAIINATVAAKHLSKEDAAALDKLPNPMLALVMRTVDGLTKAYGIKESGAHVNAGGGVATGTDVEAQRKDLRAQIAALPSRHHTADELQGLKDQLAATYTNDKRRSAA